MEHDLEDRYFLVTGSSSGIGWETVRALALRGATVVGISRASGSGAERMKRLREESGNAALHHLSADLSSLTEVRRVARDFTAQFERLDVLINNAGGFFPRRRLSPNGHEMTLALNHLGPFLLTHILLGRLLESPAPRIVNVASNAERFGNIHFDDLMLTRYGMWKAYGQSKLANVLFSYQLSRLLGGTPITVNALHPGTVATNIGGKLGTLLMKLAGPLFKTPEEGAQTTLYLATSAEVALSTGGYYSEKRPVQSTPRSRDQAIQARLWRVSSDLVGLTEAEAAPLENAAKKRN